MHEHHDDHPLTSRRARRHGQGQRHQETLLLVAAALGLTALLGTTTTTTAVATTATTAATTTATPATTAATARTVIAAAGARPAAARATRPQAGTPASAWHEIVLSGTITPADKGTYQEHAFTVPAGTTRIEAVFSYDHYRDGTELEIGLFDPQRFRGTSRFSKSRFHLTEFEATPSYLVGPLVPGKWRISLGMPAVKANSTGAWRVTIRLSSSPTPREGFAAAPLKSEPGWYAGDLHAHTLHSDGFNCEDAPAANAAAAGAAAGGAVVEGAAADAARSRRGCQPWEVVEAARAKQMDFLAITDHNTTSHHAELAGLQESLPSLLLLRGQELTTFHGHANIYGTSRIIDFRLGFRQRTIVDVLNDVAAQGALLSINHPGRDTGDRCTGCGWDAPGTPWTRVEAMEVINGGVIEGRTAGMPFWYARLNEGARITALGGSDDHAARSTRGRIGAPTTVIHARELSEAALLDGIRSGRVYVRTRGVNGPELDLSASLAGAGAAGAAAAATGSAGAPSATVEMGGILALGGAGSSSSSSSSAAAPVEVSLRLQVNRANGQRAEVVRNGELLTTLEIGSDAATLTQIVPLAAGQWVHVRVRDAKGITAFTNPIYARATAAAK